VLPNCLITNLTQVHAAGGGGATFFWLSEILRRAEPARQVIAEVRDRMLKASYQASVGVFFPKVAHGGLFQFQVGKEDFVVPDTDLR
jgi:hypothetical protein